MNLVVLLTGQRSAAVQGAAVSRAQLGDFRLAAGLLEKLALSRPDDKDVWRLLVRFYHLSDVAWHNMA